MRERERIANDYGRYQRTLNRCNDLIDQIKNENERLETSLDVLLDRLKPDAKSLESRFVNEIAMLRKDIEDYRYQLKEAEEENRINLSELESEYGGF